MRQGRNLGTVLTVAAVALFGIAAATALVGILSSWSKGRTGDTAVAPPAHGAAPAFAAPSPPVDQITLTIASNPAPALVLRDGVLIGATPMVLRVPRGSEPWDLEVTATGYEPFEMRVHSTSDRQLMASLRPVPLPGHSPPPDAYTPHPANPPGGVRPPGLPRRLNRSQIQSGMRRSAVAVSRCGRGASGRVTVDMTISGSTGRVRRASVTGQFAGTPVGSCVARTVRSTRFPRFSDDSMEIRGYPFVIR